MVYYKYCQQHISIQKGDVNVKTLNLFINILIDSINK